jgi:hypothetical protein|tara:strand:+ start:193 stop:309 length:117 start_codon:yes stop_codon:yes gene_type:complete
MTIVDHFKKMLITLGWFGTGAAIVATTVLLYKALLHLI